MFNNIFIRFYRYNLLKNDNLNIAIYVEDLSDQNKDVLLGKTNHLTKAENYDRFDLENVTKWWKKLATKRYTKMIREDKVRRELEVWNKDTMNKIDIIR